MNYISGEQAVKVIKPGERVFVHGGAATPHYLLTKLAERSSELWNVEIVSISMQGDAVIADKKYKNSFRINSLFVSQNVRQRAKELIRIAHPNHREALERAAFERFHIYEFERTVFY